MPQDDDSIRRSHTSQRRDQLGTQGERAEPRLPHERDESSDSQAQGVRGVIHQGKEDLDRGLQDTSRKPEMDAAYEQQKGAGAPGTAPAAPDRSGAGGRKGPGR
ncbi:hypothetical protein [Ideonella sp. BN130291]|uniref:hypothetical protein n=1 Tax=Ideonella sp. BN130291 TaxID=3112940 RepID=UPI002E2716B2|nr:hypothetical protein [Ideonella sp. BN130291]